MLHWIYPSPGDIDPRGTLILDGTPEEEACASGVVAVAVAPDGGVAGVAKTGSGALPAERIADALGMAIAHGKIIHAEMENALAGVELGVCGAATATATATATDTGSGSGAGVIGTGSGAGNGFLGRNRRLMAEMLDAMVE
jgi:hypothetical protein